MADDVKAMVAAENQADVAAGEEALAPGVPKAAEPLLADNVNSLGELLQGAMPKLTGGGLEVTFEPVAADVDQVPIGIAKHVLGLAAMVDQLGPKIPALAGYAIDPQMLATNDGLIELGAIVSGMASDEKVLAAVKGPMPTGEAEPEGDLGLEDEATETYEEV